MANIIKIEKIIDKYIFLPLCFIFGRKNHRKAIPNSITKILVIKFWALGDSVVLLPTLQAFKRKFPNSEVHVLAHTRNRAVFEGQDYIDNIIDFSIKNILNNFRYYDICIDAEPYLNVSALICFIKGNFRIGFSHGARGKTYHIQSPFNKNQHMVQNYLDFGKIFNIDRNTDKLIPLSISSPDKVLISEYLQKVKYSTTGLTVGIAPGVAESVKFRMWPIENFAALADTLIEKYNAQVFFIDSKSNIETIRKIEFSMKNKAINSAGIFTVKQSAELISRCDIAISNDSGFMHIAAAAGVKTIGLFGPNTPVLWGPYGANNVSIWKPKIGCPFIDNTSAELIPKQLSFEQANCMTAIEVDDVLIAIDKLLQIK
ncbi:glycosyltransferase family 9 protein [Paucibacter sp. B2R-40]|uniref:glycosyltransferase family 9 protein n=1 Tax=Paucibacter sp. B2R-40 TaxID=2893554 RepID=UPI0021E3D658|nr:glycosyltransferase family 9 protein [Paucibacter sp. B2R-40]MCV2353663.1 glycosyltransferase family 9 protein [Paucibacter sp. B2R-40]